MPPDGEQPLGGERGDLVEVAVRPRHHQLVLDRPPEAAGEVAAPASPAGIAAVAPEPLPGLGLGLLERPGRGDALRPQVRVRVGVALEQRLRPRPRRSGRARRGGPCTRHARSTSSAAAVVEQLEVLRRATRVQASVFSAAVRCSGSSARRGGHLGHPGQPPRDQHRRAPLLGGAQGEREERLDDARALLGRQHRQHAVEEVAGGQLALERACPRRCRPRAPG